jgi:DNA-binding transcriptional LysR family regulator
MVDLARGMAGELRLAAVSPAVSGSLPDDLAAFEASYPNVRIVLTEGTNSEAVSAVTERRADAALVIDHDIPAFLLRDHYAEDPVWVIAAEGHSLFEEVAPEQGVRFADVIRHELVSLARGASIEAMVASAAALIERPVRKHLEVSRYDSLRRLVEAGLGVGFIRRSGVEAYLDALRIEARPLDETWARQNIVLVRRPGAESPRVVARFADLLAKRRDGRAGATGT